MSQLESMGDGRRREEAIREREAEALARAKEAERLAEEAIEKARRETAEQARREAEQARKATERTEPAQQEAQPARATESPVARPRKTQEQMDEEARIEVATARLGRLDPEDETFLRRAYEELEAGADPHASDSTLRNTLIAYAGGGEGKEKYLDILANCDPDIKIEVIEFLREADLLSSDLLRVALHESVSIEQAIAAGVEPDAILAECPTRTDPEKLEMLCDLGASMQSKSETDGMSFYDRLLRDNGVSDESRGEGRAEVPVLAEGIEAIIARCLAKKPDDRYPNVAELARDLEPYGGDAVRGLAASIATVLRARPTARAAYASFSDISGVTDNPLGPTLDVRSDPSLSGKLSSSQRISAPSSPAVTEPPKPSEVPRARDTSEPVGASSAWGNTQNGVPPAAPRKPAWMIALGAVGLVGLGVGIALAATSRPAPNAGAQVAALSAGSPSGVASVAPSVAPVPPKAEPSAVPAVAVAVSSEPSTTPAPSASAIAPSKPGSAKAVKPGAAPSVAAQPSAAPTPSAKPTTKPASSGPPGFVPYGE